MTTLRAVPSPARTPGQIQLDEDALRDALAAYATWPESDAGYLAEVEAQIVSIRRRLPDRGARVDEAIAGSVRFERAMRPQPTDPPGSVRLRRVKPPNMGGHADDDEFPRGPLNGGAALSALAVVAASLAGLSA